MKPTEAVPFLAGGGEMAERIRRFDWSRTPLGPFDAWSAALRTTVGLITANRFPQLLWWGPSYVSIYNDAYVPVLGLKHPDALGLPVSECWSEIWHILKPLIDTPFNGGPSTWIEDFELHIQRSGVNEETHFTVAYSPVPDASTPSGIGGVLATVHEISQKVVAERRVSILRDLGTEAAENTAEEICRVAGQTLGRHGKDVPFALLYLIDPDTQHARLAGTAGIEPGGSASPQLVSLDPVGAEQGWPFAEALRGQGMMEVADLPSRFETVPSGPWTEPPHTAVLLPLRTIKGNEPYGLLIGGVSSRLKFDEQYKSFYELAANQIATAIANARAYEQERKRAEALVEIDRVKTAFFSNVSHEFRTPLTLMLGPLEDALASAELPPRERDKLDTAHRNSLRLLNLVNSLLDFSRIEAGRAQANYERVDLAALTTELASNFGSACERAGLRLVVDCPPLGEPIYVDRDMWEKIVLNLLSNAFKFTFEGEISVRLRSADGQAELTVRDTGVGIPLDQFPRLFERFHRIEGQRSRTYEGSGIGLALVQELVKLHGGTIRADSAAPGGTRFTVTIPLGHAHLPQDRIGADRKLASTSVRAASYVEEALRLLPHVADEMPAAAEAGASPGLRESAKIVLADDNADMRAYVRRLLGPRCDVQAVADGQAALEAIRERRPDLVLADVMMPRLDGFGLVHAIRSDPDLTDIPIILLSARAGEESEIEGLQTGADDYLIKPFSARELIARVDAHLKLARFRSQATETLRESEERFRAFVEAGWEMVYRMSRDWSEMRYLRGKNFIADTENPSQNWLDKYIHPDDHAAVLASIDQAIRTKQIFELEHRIIRLDGSLGWTQSRAIPVLDTKGEIIEWFGAASDITERKRAEETQQLLLRELNHRVKNTLASVQAIVQQTLRTTKDPADFAARFSGRVQSLARVHSLLTDTSWQGADLRELIRDQLLQGTVDETKLTASGPAIRFEPQTAVHVALMLHELGTNCVKYGSLSASKGRVTISWTVAGEMLNLEWVERGGPTVAATHTRGFGTTLIERIASGSGGRAQMIFEPDGITWKISLVLPAVEAGDASAERRKSDLRQPPAHPKGKIPNARAPLEGLHLLVIEDEPLIGLDLADMLEKAGAHVGHPVGSEKEALEVIDGGDHFDGALLDANLHGRSANKIAAALTRHNVPFIFITGYGRQGLPASYGQVPVLAKPVSAQQLLDAVANLVTRRSKVTRLRP
jgi:signal transduction histidine kinase/DNA-binding response OmpR family regulator